MSEPSAAAAVTPQAMRYGTRSVSNQYIRRMIFRLILSTACCPLTGRIFFSEAPQSRQITLFSGLLSPQRGQNRTSASGSGGLTGAAISAFTSCPPHRRQRDASLS